MRVAAIDIGTNTVLLLVADVNGHIETIHEDQHIIRLGKSVDADRRINEEGIGRLLTVLGKYKTSIKEYDCGEVIVVGTSAVRDAGNRDELIQRVLESTGFRIQTFSGEEEALATFLGGRMVLPQENTSDEVVLIDIGGGSTEYIVGDDRTIHFKSSLDIGSVRLTERFIRHDPVLSHEEGALTDFVRLQIARHLINCPTPNTATAIGVAGTITTAATMAQRLSQYDRNKVSGYVLTVDRLTELIDDLRGKTVEERKRIPGLHPDRADIIFAGLLILRESMRHFGFKRVVTSHYGLRYGLIRKFMKAGAGFS